MSITKKQWVNIHLEMLGLRSEDNPTVIKSAASYAMDCKKKWNDPIPDNWEELLKGTIKHMQEFDGYKQRYLLIVAKSVGADFEYADCFPKCSAKATVISASISLDGDVDTLAGWVEQNIPG